MQGNHSFGARYEKYFFHDKVEIKEVWFYSEIE